MVDVPLGQKEPLKIPYVLDFHQIFSHDLPIFPMRNPPTFHGAGPNGDEGGELDPSSGQDV
jgi:hypothetical protein